MRWSWLAAVLFYACQSPTKEMDHSSHLFSLLSPSSTGIRFQNRLEESPTENHLVHEHFISGAGVGIGDINNDGLPDLYFTGNQEQDRLYLNKGDMVFEDITKAAGIYLETMWSSGATFADVNNDGMMDIYVCKYDYQSGGFAKNLLYMNNGDLTFTEQASECGLDYWGLSVQGSFLDYDLDGDLDLYLVNQPNSMGFSIGHDIPFSELPEVEQHTDRMFENLGSGKFKDVTDSSGVRNIAYGLAATIGDFNDDHLPDIYVSNDYEQPDHLYINQGGKKFKDAIHTSMKHLSFFSMGTDVADYDNDGLLDIMVADMLAEDHFRIKTNMGGMDPNSFWKNVNEGRHYQYMFNTLQRNNGNGTFSDVAQLAGVTSTDWSWSSLLADFDNDGWKDLFVTNGERRAIRNSDFDKFYGRIMDSLQVVAAEREVPIWQLVDFMRLVEMCDIVKLPNYAFKNNGDLTFTKSNQEWGLDKPGLSYGAAYADLDADGDLDLITNNTDEVAHIYRNNTVEKNLGNFVRVHIMNEFGSPSYGARVRLFKDGQFWQLQELVNTRGYKSKSEDILHFGLGKENVIQEMVITWPDGRRLVKQEVAANQVIRVSHSEGVLDEDQDDPEPKSFPLFSDITEDVGIDHLHTENEFDDYEKQVLLPHKLSNFGPNLAVGDINSDGLEDFYVGGASGNAGALYVQTTSGTFKRSSQSGLDDDSIREDLGAEFFDSDGDGDLDLYVVSGGNEFSAGSRELQDRLYLNDGKGQFKACKNCLPEMHTSGSTVISADYDRDGDMDLFVGGRLVPDKYPWPVKSYILRNDSQPKSHQPRFSDVTLEVAPKLNEAGLVTSAVWTDFTGDGNPDLAIVGEWMAVRLFENQDNHFIEITEESGLANTTGWYYHITSADMDQDGDMDFIVGNLGLNYKYKASETEPFEVYSTDFDENGKVDIVLGYAEHGELYPLRGRECSSQQLPSLAQKFPTYESFGKATLREVYGPELDYALNYKAQSFASSYVENLGDGTFRVHKLPNLAQTSSVNGILVQDFSLDGHLDILLTGNLYPVEIETPRNDAGTGLLLTGDGKGNFSPVSLLKSGFYAPHDAKDMKVITVGRGKNAKQVILVANNQEKLQAIHYDPKAAKENGLNLLSLD